MPKICYVPKKFTNAHIEIIDHANDIIEEYEKIGFNLTLRQLYYQFVSRDLIPNQQKEYKRLGGIINDARLAGEIDWESIIDRTRNLERLARWSDPSDIIKTCARQFHIDLWEDQPRRVEVWIEKDALVGVIEGICNEYDVPYFSCRGYTSQSEMWSAAQRLMKYVDDFEQEPLILHLGDHDPSGIDMSRDIEDRLTLFMEHHGYDAPDVERIALNMNQVKRYGPPPNPAKLTDARASGYISKHGHESWELDALDPRTMANLIRDHIEGELDVFLWDAKLEERKRGREQLTEISNRWTDVTNFIEGER